MASNRFTDVLAKLFEQILDHVLEADPLQVDTHASILAGTAKPDLAL